MDAVYHFRMHEAKFSSTLREINDYCNVKLTKLLRDANNTITKLSLQEKSLRVKLGMAYIRINGLEEHIVHLTIKKPPKLTRQLQYFLF